MKSVFTIILFCSLSMALQAQDSLLYVPLKPGSNDRLLHYRLQTSTSRSPEDIKGLLEKFFRFRVQDITVSEGRLKFSFSDTMMLTKNDIPTRVSFNCTVQIADSAYFDFYMIYYQGVKKNGNSWTTMAEEAIADDLVFNQKGKADKLRAEYKIKTLTRMNNLALILSGQH